MGQNEPEEVCQLAVGSHAPTLDFFPLFAEDAELVGEVARRHESRGVFERQTRTRLERAAELECVAAQRSSAAGALDNAGHGRQQRREQRLGHVDVVVVLEDGGECVALLHRRAAVGAMRAQGSVVAVIGDRVRCIDEPACP